MKFFLGDFLDIMYIFATIITNRGCDRDELNFTEKGKIMKKTLVALFGLVVLGGCAGYYDYYKGGVRYTQDGEDCVFYSAERGRRYSDDIRSLNTDKKIVYRNTNCRDLYVRDTANVAPRNARQVLSPAADDVDVKPTCNKVVKKRYVFVK